VRASEALLWVAFALSILLIAYTGVLLSATSQPLWSETWLLPALFVASAISTGAGALMVALLLGKRTDVRALNFLGRVDPVFTTIELVTLVAFLFGLGAAGTVITTGTLGLLFWVGAVLAGILVPLGLAWRARVQGKESSSEALLAALWSIMGGLVLRAVIVLGGQIYG
jgi:formate-dependent nitrite reductase membrane component NrfD